MKKISIILAEALMALALVVTCSSCTKKEDVLRSAPKKEKQTMTQEQSKRLEEVRRGVEESKKLVVARVNGSDITMYSLVKEMNVIVPNIVPAGKPTTPEITKMVKKKALDNLIFRELAVQEARRQGMRVEPEAVGDVIGKVKAQAGSEEAYKKYLEERNMNEDALRKIIESSHLFEMITAREIFDKIKVDDKTLRDRYEKDRASLMTKDSSPRHLSFEEARDFLASKIKSERSEKKMAEWDNKLREKAKIEVMPSEV